MEQKTAFCPACEKDVHISLTTDAHYGGGGQANLPEGHQVVCLDFGVGCSTDTCPLSGLPAVVMGVRLAKSGLDHDWKKVHAVCAGCGEVTDLDVVDERYGYCELCGTTNSLTLLKLEDGAYVSVTEKPQ